MKDWQILTSFVYPHEANMVKTYLDSEGIETIVKDEMTVQVNNFYSNAIGGVKLLVRTLDYEKGIETLEKGGYIGDAHKTKNRVETLFYEVKSDKKKCPYCRSENIGKRRNPDYLVLVVYLLLGAIFPIFRNSYKCFDCSKEWKFKRKK
ncbi:putative signal transducing protein [Saccharicrinis fermentans]|uniref:DUF2007 domain-containing protein n=1 Tax=Saccharicrinis fermentans DSM 9555 = JCM 21142 TaxID=869213 RepID=W7YQL0_9BACT|nr:DUF2007 domain-containing protein [Saccharicrinis fermentans]GAF04709.1 hypothetical protein JCM21142_93426 [Saccharicrinis fermentans DSM 9555 = JCM 21142]